LDRVLFSFTFRQFFRRRISIADFAVVDGAGRGALSPGWPLRTRVFWKKFIFLKIQLKSCSKTKGVL
jgi:hypothetical protein